MPLERARTLRAPVDGGELRLECVDVRPEGGDPVRLDGFAQQVELVAGEVGWGEKEAGHGAASLALRQ